MMHCESSYTASMKVLMVFVYVVSLGLAVDDYDGQYVHDDSGRYIPDDEGRYIPDDLGRYLHDGLGNYRYDGSGIYKGGDNGRYSGLNGNLITASTRNKPIVEVRPVRTSTVTPITRQPLQTYNNLKEGRWKVLRQLADIDTDGYHWEYETENKIIAEESGKLHNVGTDAETMRAKGFFQYTGPDDVVYAVEYTADENGFVPVGNHLPTPPPVPGEIAEALELNKAGKRL